MFFVHSNRLNKPSQVAHCRCWYLAAVSVAWNDWKHYCHCLTFLDSLLQGCPPPPAFCLVYLMVDCWPFIHLVCISQKSWELFRPENISRHFSGAIFGFEKVFLKTSERVPIFSGIFSWRSYSCKLSEAHNFSISKLYLWNNFIFSGSVSLFFNKDFK